MSDAGELVTGRGLVAELQRLGVGTWTPAAVRQWIREEPPLPIAEAADQGKPHRYRIGDVLSWMRVRALAERAKGFTRADGADLVARIDAALRGEPLAVSDPGAAQVQAENLAAITSPSPGAGGAPAAPAGVSPAKAAAVQTDWLALSDVEALLQVLQGRDPRNWKAAEEAMTTRRERLEAERRLIPSEELESALTTFVENTRRAIDAARQQLKQQLRDYVSAERKHDLERAVDESVNGLLAQMAAVDDPGGAA